MPRTEIRWKNVRNFLDILNPGKFEAELNRNMRRATALNGKIAERFVRMSISKGNFAPNAPLTIALKKSNKPLADKGDLFQAITSQIIDAYTVHVGIFQTSKVYDTAVAVHDGVSIRVTPAMRGMFFLLYKASIGEFPASKLEGRAAELFSKFQDWKPLKPSTQIIVIPPRPFLEGAMEDEGLRRAVQENWRQALRDVFVKRAAKGKQK